MSETETCVLGIDTSLRSTGVGVVRAEGSRLRALEYGTLRTSSRHPLTDALAHLHEGLTALIARHHPNVAAIEGVFFARNARTSLVLGQARGVVLLACRQAGIPVYEYAPRRAKQAVTGHGAASKEQVERMVAALLQLPLPIEEDAADALALAVCHLNLRTGVAELMPDPL